MAEITIRIDHLAVELSSVEAEILEEWLWTRDLGQRQIARRLREADAQGHLEPLVLDASAVDALRRLLSGTDAGDYAGLTILRDTVCGPGASGK